MLTEDRIVAAYTLRGVCMENLAKASESLISLKNKRAVELAQKVEAGLYAECKNEDQRKAAAAFAFQATDAIVKSVEAGEREAQLALDLANNDVSMVRSLLEFEQLPADCH